MKKLYYLLFLLIAFSACEKEEQIIEFEKKPNHNPPENNNLVINEQLHGNSSSESSFWQIENSGKGTFYSLGKLNAADATYDVIVGDETNSEGYFEYIVGELSTSGELIKEKHPGFITRYIYPFTQTTGSFQNGLIVVGLSTNPTSARIIIYDNELSANSIVYSSSEENTWFNSITFKEQNGNLFKFIAAGGKEISDVDYPYLCEIIFDANNLTLTAENSKIFNEYPNSLVANIKYDITNSSCFCSLSNYMNGERYNFTLLSLSSNLEVQWSNLIQYQSYQTRHSLNSMVLYDNNIFIASYAKDPEKGETASGSLWDSGLITCVDYSGNSIWQTKVSLTDRDEELYQIGIEQNKLFACGMHSCFISKKQDVDNWDEYWQYGNGLICKLDIYSGNILSSYTFGNADYESGIHDFIYANGEYHAVGWTKAIDESAGNHAWYLKMSGL